MNPWQPRVYDFLVVPSRFHAFQKLCRRAPTSVRLIGDHSSTNKELKSKNTDLEREVVRLQQEIKYFLSKKFGRSADVTHPGQGHLFDEAERDAPSAAPEDLDAQDTVNVSGHVKRRGRRRPLPASAGVS